MVDVLNPFNQEATMPARADATQITDTRSGFLFEALPEAEIGHAAKTSVLRWESIDPANQKFVMQLLAKSLQTSRRVYQSVGKDEGLQATLIDYAKAATPFIPEKPGYEKGYSVLAQPVYRAENGDWAGVPASPKDRAEKVPVGAELGVSIRVTNKKGRQTDSAS